MFEKTLAIFGKQISAAILVIIFLALPSIAGAKSKYKVGYLEAGTYWTYTESLNAIKKVLNKPERWAGLGWKGKINFLKNAYFSPGWDNEKELTKRAKELMARKDIDLIIAAGTAATGALLEANNHRTPILAMSVADAVKSKFVTSQNDSGIDNFTVRIVPGRYKRMFEIFHDVIGFKKLGLVYSDTDNGKKYSNVEDARQVAKERGFKLIEYKKISRSEKSEECLAGINNLIEQGIDAFFIPSLNCFDWALSDVKILLDNLTEHKIPTFARGGTKFVKAGALIGFSTIDFSGRGQFLAERLIKILQGAKARSLSMVDNATPKISLNIYTAEKIGFDPSFDILGASDEIFQEITLPEERSVK